MSNELTRERFEEWAEALELGGVGTSKILCGLLDSDAALRASRDAERERAEAAERDAQMHLLTISYLSPKVAYLTAKLKAMYAIHPESEGCYGALPKLRQQLAASEQRVKVLEEGYANQSQAVAKREAGFQAAIDQLQATVANREHECEVLRGQRELAEAKCNQLQVALTSQQGEIERLREELVGILQDWDGPTKVGFTHKEYFATLFSERRDRLVQLVTKGEKKGPV